VDRDDDLDRLFFALADRTRRRMLAMLAQQTLNVSELGEPFDLTKQAVSKHLRVLEDAGLVIKTRDGRIQRCRFNPQALEAVQRIVSRYREFWGQRLDALDDYINKVKRKE
jgi:DNA-binding transcriptional ArsR family regulator